MSLPTLLNFAPQQLLALRQSQRIEPGTVHVWGFALEDAPECVAQCRQWLSQQESQRADRFVFPRDRLRFILAHGVMRHLLGLYTDLAPEALRFQMEPGGKPSLRSPGATAVPHFNLTHSADRAALALSWDGPLGVDLEELRADIEALAISRNYFFGTEREAIESAAASRRAETFFRYWVAKEAVLKAQGIGLGFPLDRFCVEFRPDGEQARITTLDAAVLSPDWTVRMLQCDTGWSGAIASAGEHWRVRVCGL